VAGNIAKVCVGRQHREVVAETELRQQRIDGPDLNARASAFVSQVGRVDMIAPVGDQQWQCGEAIENLCTVSRSDEPLQKLLQNEPGRREFLTGFDSTDQFA